MSAQDTRPSDTELDSRDLGESDKYPAIFAAYDASGDVS
jgi:hypothetical protein